MPTESHTPNVNAAPNRVAVRVTPDALRRIRGGHPWVFDRSIRSVDPIGRAGDLAVVFDERKRFAAVGLFDPEAPIAIRVLHHGVPTPIDAAWIRERMVDACALRRSLVRAMTRASTDAPSAGYRVVNGENDGLGGLVIDRYADVLVVKIYTAAWIPWLEAVIDGALEVTGVGTVVVRRARHVVDGPADGSVVAGGLEDPVVRFGEWGLDLEADVVRGQKTGYFLDQRANRRRIGGLADGAAVLDVFAATGGFGAHAAAGGAASVHSIDASGPTLAVAERNVGRNATERAFVHATEVGDAFDALRGLRRAGRRFDVVVVDPPAFAQRAADVERAARAYDRLARLALDVTAPGGVLMLASCSSRVSASRFFETVAPRVAERGGREIARTGHDTDHPVTFPEGEYLKAGFWRLPAQL
ncbi:MAG: class I SAM-dependent rRNA methyltransferase [Actinomycetota bacterium]